MLFAPVIWKNGNMQVIYSKSWKLLLLMQCIYSTDQYKVTNSTHRMLWNATVISGTLAKSLSGTTFPLLKWISTYNHHYHFYCPREPSLVPSFFNRLFNYFHKEQICPYWTFHVKMTKAAYLWDQFLPERWGVVVAHECHRNNPAFFQSDSCHLPTSSEWKWRQQPASPSLKFKKYTFSNISLWYFHSICYSKIFYKFC